MLRRDVQGLRAVAVLLVLASHAHVPGMAGGFVGVDVFFVISGFLITGQLNRMLEDERRLRLADFYARRARRILPAAAVVSVLTMAAAVVWVTPVRLPEVLRQGVAALLSGVNIVLASNETDYLAETVPSPFRQYWSLGVEEQFYLLWPLMLAVLFVVARRRRRWVAAGLGAVVAASFAACVAETAAVQPLAFFLLPFRAWELGAGGLLALLPVTRLPAAVRMVGSWAGLALIAVSTASAAGANAYPGALAALPVLGAIGVIAGSETRFGAVAILRLRPLQFVGAISYSLYLVHWPILILPREATQWAVPFPVPVDLLLAAGSVLAAWLLYRFVEQPARAVRLPNRSVLIAAGTATAVLVALGGGAAVVAERPRLAAGRSVPNEALAPDPAPARFVPANLTPSLAAGFGEEGALRRAGCQQDQRQAVVLECAFGDLGGDRTVALFGDSHAGRLFPAFEGAARTGRFRLETFVKSSCRSIDSDARWARTATPSCGAWRAEVTRRLLADPPDVIVLANHLSDRRLSEGLPWTTMVQQTVARLPRASRVVLMADWPQLPQSPLYCLSAHTDDARGCGVAPTAAFDAGSFRALERAVTPGRVGLLDIRDYFCNVTWCPAIIGNSLVYTDEHHITDEFSARLAGPVLRRLTPWL